MDIQVVVADSGVWKTLHDDRKFSRADLPFQTGERGRPGAGRHAIASIAARDKSINIIDPQSFMRRAAPT